jgi:hypothetical protein
MIENDGEDIRATNYWASEHARAGFFYLSGNAGVWRLLVPTTYAHALLAEIKTATHVVLEQSQRTADCVDVVFEDGTDTPYVVTIDKKQSDRGLGPSGPCRVAIWTAEGKQLELPGTTVA